MRHILCFGDSNTHGYIPGGGRYDEDTRWPCILARLLGPEYKIIEEGQNGRTSSFDDPFEPFKNAMAYIIPCLQTHEPLELTVLMLGSNDLKDRFAPSVEKISDSLRQLAGLIRDYSQAPVLLVSPILLGDRIEASDFGPSYSSRALSVSRGLSGALKRVADELGVYFLNAADYAAPSEEDCLHMNADGHRALAEAIADKITEIFK